MRKAYHYIMVLMLVVGCCTFASCDSDAMDEDYLEGRWWSVDDYYDVIELNLTRGGTGTCTETYYDRFGRISGVQTDLFDWYIRQGRINVIFRNGYYYGGQRWIWDYRIANGHTVAINGRLFTRDRNYYSDWYYGYYSKKHQTTPSLQP
ncbi:MAG: hypothetical protein IJ244_07755 [Bacteroidaceae bacterium]|nr:hypothetical protein [Bacteroidaceae bacterium]